MKLFLCLRVCEELALEARPVSHFQTHSVYITLR